MSHTISHSEETKNKISEALIGRKQSSKTIEKRAQKLRGKVRSQETKDIMRFKKLGAKNPRWNGGIYSTNNQIRRSPQYKNWQYSVYERDNYTCQICGKTNKLRANHIKKFSTFPELRFELYNGITICQNCDFKFVLNRENEWEDYFNFSLEVRGLI